MAGRAVGTGIGDLLDAIGVVVGDLRHVLTRDVAHGARAGLGHAGTGGGFHGPTLLRATAGGENTGRPCPIPLHFLTTACPIPISASTARPTACFVSPSRDPDSMPSIPTCITSWLTSGSPSTVIPTSTSPCSRAPAGRSRRVEASSWWRRC